ncbi:hypothetical protein MPER_14175 [Moniliophthora perniciosa FA553]|nr:hypothetical protein MPER_14175 [Moniliophthora perniciosa FA553]
MAFKSPVSRIYSTLPPPRKDLDDVFAVLWSGPAHPTTEDYRRTPFLVRRKAITISEENLSSYPEDRPPFTVEWKESMTNKTPESTSLHDDEEEDGVEGDVELTVHGITGEELDTMDLD